MSVFGLYLLALGCGVVAIVCLGYVVRLSSDTSGGRIRTTLAAAATPWSLACGAAIVAAGLAEL
jgi:hypothetical protein